MPTSHLDSHRLSRAKRAFTTRRVGVERMATLLTGDLDPRSGDLVLARVEEIGKQTRLELTDGRRAHLFPGDEIIVCFGNRYAPDQFEAVIGGDLGGCDLVAAGGIASTELSRNARMIAPTKIAPIGLVGDEEGRRLNLDTFRLPEPEGAPPIPCVLSVGTSMNAGKTLAATSLVRGLRAAGARVAAIKATGTGAGGDIWLARDAGADVVLDFTDAGFASTYLIPQPEIEAGIRRLLAHAAGLGCEIAVVEIADGLEHRETAAVVAAEHLWTDCVGALFSAYDAMGAKRGVDLLQATGRTVLAVSGRLTMSPLGMREAARATELVVVTPAELQAGALNQEIAARICDRDARLAARLAAGRAVQLPVPIAANGQPSAAAVLRRTAERIGAAQRRAGSRLSSILSGLKAHEPVNGAAPQSISAELGASAGVARLASGQVVPAMALPALPVEREGEPAMLGEAADGPGALVHFVDPGWPNHGFDDDGEEASLPATISSLALSPPGG